VACLKGVLARAFGGASAVASSASSSSISSTPMLEETSTPMQEAIAGMAFLTAAAPPQKTRSGEDLMSAKIMK
jgi:hypothetical protein